jgi:acetylornithine deacetylase
VDAIARRGGVLTALERLDATLADGPPHGLVGRSSVHASTISGGQEFSSYPARCVLTGEYRTVPGERSDIVSAALREVVANAGGEDAELRVLWARDPFELEAGAPLVDVLGEAAATVLGSCPTLAGRPYWTDAALLAAAGIPTVVFGPGGDGAHADVEWVELGDVESVARTLVEVARRLCR